MRPVKYTITAWQGKTYEHPFQWKVNAATPVPVDMTGWTGRMQIRPTIDSETVTLELTTENGGIIIDEPEGTVTIYITDEQMAGIAKSTYKYDLELETASGRVYGPLYGSFKVKAEVTRESE